MSARAVLLVVLVAGCGGEAAHPTVERGRYLVDTIGACGYCHTPINADGTFDQSRKLAGVVDRFDLGDAGKLSAPNLTPAATGLRDWSDAEVKRVLHQGILRGGEVMWWVMPYFETANFTDEDLDSIVLYLRSLPPVENMLPPRPPYTARALPYLPISGDLIPKATLSASSSDVSRARAVRGRYLASCGCMTCHTPFGAGDYRRDPTMLFAGDLKFSVIPRYHTQEVYSKNLTPHPNGTADTPTPTLAATIKRTGATSLCGPMSLLVREFYSGFTDEDAQAIATYLKNIPPLDTGVIPTCTP